MVLAKLLVLASAAKAARVRNHEDEVTSLAAPEFAIVDGTYTFGAPATAKDPLRNVRTADGCFPGARVWTRDRPSLVIDVDMVPRGLAVFGYEHAMMNAVELNVKEGKESRRDFACNRQTANEPDHGIPHTYLHSADVYIGGAEQVAPEYVNEVTIATAISLEQDEEVVAELVKDMGYGLVGTGFHDGKGFSGGPQASHLLQDLKTLDCLVTFQGSSSFGDWVADADIKAVPFCGLAQKVHRGFRDHLRRIVQTDSWQTNVRAKFPKCNRVILVGHSLAGAMSELFAACNAAQPTSGEGFEEDFKYMSWKKGTTEKMPYL